MSKDEKEGIEELLKTSTLNAILQGIEGGRFRSWTDEGKEELVRRIVERDSK